MHWELWLTFRRLSPSLPFSLSVAHTLLQPLAKYLVVCQGLHLPLPCPRPCLTLALFYMSQVQTIQPVAAGPQEIFTCLAKTLHLKMSFPELWQSCHKVFPFPRCPLSCFKANTCLARAAKLDFILFIWQLVAPAQTCLHMSCTTLRMRNGNGNRIGNNQLLHWQHVRFCCPN